MFQYWLFADHGIYSSAPHTYASLKQLERNLADDGVPRIEGEFLIYVAG